MNNTWRLENHINVYDGDVPVCQCQTAAYAKQIVVAVNRSLPKEPAKAKLPDSGESFQLVISIAIPLTLSEASELRELSDDEVKMTLEDDPSLLFKDTVITVQR